MRLHWPDQHSQANVKGLPSLKGCARNGVEQRMLAQIELHEIAATLTLLSSANWTFYALERGDVWATTRMHKFSAKVQYDMRLLLHSVRQNRGSRP